MWNGCSVRIWLGTNFQRHASGLGESMALEALPLWAINWFQAPQFVFSWFFDNLDIIARCRIYQLGSIVWWRYSRCCTFEQTIHDMLIMLLTVLAFGVPSFSSFDSPLKVPAVTSVTDRTEDNISLWACIFLCLIFSSGRDGKLSSCSISIALAP